MATKLDSLGFTFNNQHSSKFHILNAHSESALFSETFLPTRQVKEEKLSFSDRTYLKGYEYTSDNFELQLFFEDGWLTEENYQNVQDWLSVEGYHSMVFDKFPEVIYKVTYVESPLINHDGNQQGFITITFKRDSSFTYGATIKDTILIGSRTIRTEDRDINRVKDSGYHELFLKGTEVCYPVVKITKYGKDGLVEVRNRRNNTSVSIKNMQLGETVEFDCDLEMVTSNTGTQYFVGDIPIYDLHLERGRNKLLFKGEALIEVYYQPTTLR